MRSFLSGLLLMGLLVLMSHAMAEEVDTRPVLRVLNWTYYIAVDDDMDESLPEVERSPILQEFMKKYNCRIEYILYESEDEFSRFTTELGNKLDVVNVDQSEVKRMAFAGLSERLTKDNVPNVALIGDRARDIVSKSAREYCAPYLSGKSGILYRKDLCPQPITSWQQYFHPSEKSAGKINALNAAGTMFVSALCHQGKPADTMDPNDFKSAAKELLDMRKKGLLTHVSSDIETIIEKLHAGELHMSVMYSGDALSAIEEDEKGQLEFAVPKEGCELYLDSWVVMKNAPQKELALAFVNYMLDPQVHARNAMYLQAPCPNLAARAYMQEHAPAILQDKRLYPEQDPEAEIKVYSFTDDALINRLWKYVLEQ